MKKLPIVSLLTVVSLAVIQAAGTASSTNFPLTENPISEGGKWITGKAFGLDWSDVATQPGLAFGTQTGSGGYNDSLAILNGNWSADQSGTATVHSVNQVGGNVFEEVEILLRFAIGAHSARGYEINFRSLNSTESYTQIVRWNGPLGSFTLLDARGGSSYGIRDGDTVKATIVGNTITSYINGVAKLSVTDSTFSTGSPGMGFYLQGASGVNGNYGFTSYTASDNGTVPSPPAPPTNVRIIR
jgi:hypothetical protein